MLSPEVVAALRTLIRSTEFFSQPAKDTSFATDTGESVLKINSEGSERTLTYHYRPQLSPLTQPIWKLITQAFTTKAIESDIDIYTATGAVQPTHSGMKVLQPEALKAPLMTYIRDHDDRQKVQWSLEALAWITTPEEYSGFVSIGIEAHRTRDTILTIIGTHPFYGSIPDSHLQALCPIYLSYAKDFHSRLNQLSSAEKEALSDFTRLLGETRYEPAIPLLTQWFDDHIEPYITTSLTPLAKMGSASLRSLTPYLERPEEPYRLNAIELLTIASRLGPHGGYANPLTDNELGRMIPIYTDNILPQLMEMSQSDPSRTVRDKATKALDEIQNQISKEQDSNMSLQRDAVPAARPPRP